MQTILFASVHDAGRSQMAAAWAAALADPERLRALSAGTQPAAQVHAEVAAAMAELGLALPAAPRRLTAELAGQATLLVTMGGGDDGPVVPGLARRDWPLPDPGGRPLAEVRAIRDDVRDRVLALLRELDAVAPVQLAPLTAAHGEAVLRIYADGIATGDATFETAPPSWPRWDEGHLAAPRLVALINDRVVGWAALSKVSDRCVYGGVAEVSVYVAAETRGRGVGALLLRGLVEASEAAGFWTLQAGVFPENGASLAIHAKAGFRVVGTRERLGQLRGQWRDVLLLERRSARVG